MLTTGFLLMSVVCVVTSYVNDFDRPVLFQCPPGKSIASWESYHNNHHEDRRHRFTCQTTPELGECQWSGYVNDFDQPVSYQCPNNGVISGVNSFHNNHHEDRRFKFYCCSVRDRHLVRCSRTDYLNWWDRKLNFRVPAAHFLTGVYSIHHNHHDFFYIVLSFFYIVLSFFYILLEFFLVIVHLKQYVDQHQRSLLHSWFGFAGLDSRLMTDGSAAVDNVDSGAGSPYYTNPIPGIPVLFHSYPRNHSTKPILSHGSPYYTNPIPGTTEPQHYTNPIDPPISGAYPMLLFCRLYVIDSDVCRVHSMSIVVILLALASMTSVASKYANDYDQPLLYQCPRGKSIASVHSVHHNGAEDRRYGFSCKTTPGLRDCSWHGYVNGFDEIILFQCPNNGVISGVNSYHDNGAEDRRFKFYCCSIKAKRPLVNCRFGNFVNGFDQPFNFYVRSRFLKGVFSYHHNGAEDRRWRFETCQLGA
ncbi:uncharacterized protein [Haliotis asinina]|uniref:uncharacterized protein n=1 Tax=Haliotis asinina TaxID=109174 RepID=UPI003531AAD2